ncbi:hypothetical protein DKX38_024085 [Salix brachista]|uniref:Uncharacterized protein n=1 Tax=Salix brachista TaxID=2182728 RepID=A0A5N5JMC9_9ROSI|nr:hypothetical protein DKX38_024085 [Salix brachista]
MISALVVSALICISFITTPAGMAMMPMLLPDGRIGHVLQQPGMQAHSSPQPKGDRGRGASSSSGGRRSNDRGHSRYNPY